MKIIVLAGGLSPERDVSLSSGSLVANALIENGHEVMLLDLYLGKNNNKFKPIYHNNKENFRYKYNIKNKEPDLKTIKKLKKDTLLIDTSIINICKEADKVFLALHGSIGENGQLQSLLDIYNIKYTGTSSLGSMLAMNKDISKRIMKQSNISTPNWHYINISQSYNLDNIKYPCVIKPCSCGSSIGISIINNKKNLKKAIKYATKYESEIIIEEKIEGREFTVGILNNKALPVTEIKPIKGFYNYKNKYQKGLTIEQCPAIIPDNIKNMLQKEAIKVHNILHLGTYSRIDFLMDNKNKIYCIEANTLPGMTPTSLLPQAAKAAKIPYNELCEIIIKS